MVVFPEPLCPNIPNFSFGSRIRYKLFIAFTFLQQQHEVYVLFNDSIFVDNSPLFITLSISLIT